MSEPPITWEELETYQRFAGDLDGHVRCTRPDARVSDNTWRRIDDLRHIAQASGQPVLIVGGRNG